MHLVILFLILLLLPHQTDFTEFSAEEMASARAEIAKETTPTSLTGFDWEEDES